MAICGIPEFASLIRAGNEARREHIAAAHDKLDALYVMVVRCCVDDGVILSGPILAGHSGARPKPANPQSITTGSGYGFRFSPHAAKLAQAA